MTESTKVRLALCPKCENLLPELADYSVYKCGGCGAVLRAKTENCEPETSSEKWEEDRLGRVPTKFRIFSEKDIVDSCDAGGKSTAGSLKCDTTRNEPKLAADKCCVGKGNDISANKDEVVNLTGTENEIFDSKFGHTGGSQILGDVPDWDAGKQEEMEGFPRIPRDVTEDHPDERPSNRQLDASYGLQAQTDQDGSGRILLEEDRAMLLRKLNEIKEQLSRSCNVVDKPKDKVPLDGRVAPPESFGGVGSWFPNGSSASQNPSLPFYGPDKDGSRAGPSYFAQFPESYAYPGANAMTPHGLHPPMLDPNHVPAYGNAFGSGVLGRTSHQLPGEYQQLPPHPYFPRQYNGSDHHPFMPYPQSSVLHHASCSCFHCYEKHQRVPAPVPTSAFGNRRFPDMPNNPIYHIENPMTLGSRTAMPPPLNVHGTQAHARLPRDINSETGGCVQGCPQRMVLAGGRRRLCPMAGGAPFITCYNCFELLQMPRKLQLMVKNEQQVRCGACSTVISFIITNKRLVIRDHAKAMEISVEADDISNAVAKDCSSHFHGHANQISANFSSDDYDHSGYEYQSMDRESNALSMGKALNSVKARDMQSICSSSPSISEDENSPNREEVNSIDQPIKSILAPPPAGSPLQEHFDYSTNNRAVNRFGKGNHSNHSDQEIVVSNNGTTRQSSFKEASLPTEMEVAFNEYSNTETSQDSRDGIEEDDQPKMTRGGESFFANINFKESSKYNQIEEHGKRNVSVNGHPLPECVVKKAERTAGRIQPGQYWYDFRAGFWGVLGGPCLGIIPPQIEEFNYPMPENCAGGSSGVFVNGRELHQKDLELLANRGLPTDRDRYYIIEISGRVLDEDTGEELCKLGKLAPTVLKVKHGFGMKVGRAAV
nr:hypothetical protein B456_001G156300 [Gossypium raimondii]